MMTTTRIALSLFVCAFAACVDTPAVEDLEPRPAAQEASPDSGRTCSTGATPPVTFHATAVEPAVADPKLRRGDSKAAELGSRERAAWTPPPVPAAAARALEDYLARSAGMTGDERAAFKRTLLVAHTDREAQAVPRP